MHVVKICRRGKNMEGAASSWLLPLLCAFLVLTRPTNGVATLSATDESGSKTTSTTTATTTTTTTTTTPVSAATNLGTGVDTSSDAYDRDGSPKSGGRSTHPHLGLGVDTGPDQYRGGGSPRARDSSSYPRGGVDIDTTVSYSYEGGGSPTAGRRRSNYPRILTILTTYSERSRFIKAYKERAWDRDDGYRPPLFVVSNEDDEDPDEVVDFRVGSSKGHRLLAAVTEACKRYEGMFDWLAIGDDDTVFMYARAKAFLRHINHTQPVALGKVDGLSLTARPGAHKRCFSPEDKGDSSQAVASNGCCLDFTHPCKVPPYPLEEELEDAVRRGYDFSYKDYGPGGLFWPYGGSGTFVSAGLAIDVVGSARGWGHCARAFGHFNTDIQLAQCLKLHGYSMGAYPEGFTELETSDPGQIRATLTADCQIMGVHLGIKHLADGSNYTLDSFGDAVAAVRDEDLASMREKNRHLHNLCHESWAALSKWKS